MAELTLAGDFPDATDKDWRALVEKALKGAPFASLESKTYDGATIEPLYARALGRNAVAGRPAQTPWTVMQRIDIADPEAANDQIMDDLYNGAPGLSLIFPGATADFGYALDPSEAAVERMLGGVLFDKGIELELNFGPGSRPVAAQIAKLVQASGADLDAVKLRFGYDPMSALAMGILPKPWAEIAPGFASHIGELAAQGFNGPFAAADSRVVHGAGGSEAQELAFLLASALTYLRAFEAAGIALDQARDFLFFRLVADQNQFLTMAKFRALRKLWARVEQACGLAPKPIFVSAESAWRMMTRRDPYGNIVRATIACVGAALGGADAIALLPYTAALGVPRDHARRVARNTQLILIEESHLAKVADPATGSGALEAMTDDLAREAWTMFQAIEADGGLSEALLKGTVQGRVAETRQARDKNVARRKDAIIGTSDFPDLDETSIEIDTPVPSTAPASPFAIEPLPRYRLTEPFEALRDASDEAMRNTGKRPAVFLAALGAPADFTARVTFARSFFGAGGFESILPEKPLSETGEPPRFEISDVVADFKASGADLVCLCSSDKVYAAEAEAAVIALKGAGARLIYLAGRPKEPEALEKAGVGGFIFQGCDTLDTLQRVQAFVLKH